MGFEKKKVWVYLTRGTASVISHALDSVIVLESAGRGFNPTEIVFFFYSEGQ